MRRIIFYLLCFPVLHAQETAREPEMPSLRVHGQSTIEVAPDQVEIDIGVTTQAQTAQAATDQNNGKSSAVMHRLRGIVSSVDLKTINFAVNPNFVYPKGGTPAIQGYRADVTVRVLLNDVSRVRELINAALGAGATSVNRLNFTLRSEKEARARALADAAEQARTSAEVLANAMHVRLGRILRIEEGQPVMVSPAPQIDLVKAQSTDMSPISPGSIQLHADVNLTYELLGSKVSGDKP